MTANDSESSSSASIPQGGGAAERLREFLAAREETAPDERTEPVDPAGPEDQAEPDDDAEQTTADDD